MPHRAKILIVDDEPRMCDSLQFLLSNQDHEVCTANSGQEALDYLAKDDFDVVLLDIVMPNIDGHQLMDYINFQNQDTLVIVITGKATLDSAVHALRSKAYDYFNKPVEPDELLKTVQNAINQIKLKYENQVLNENLTLSEKRYRYLVEYSPDIIYTLDDQGNFTFINNAVEQVIGIKSEKLIGEHYTNIVYEEDLEKAKWFFNERRTGNRATSGVEIRLKVSSNADQIKHCEIRHMTVELKSSGIYEKPVTEKKKTYLGTYGVARDITEKKKLESQLQRAQKMEALGTLAGGVAHDLNNILSGLVSYPELLLMDLPKESPLRSSIATIQRSGEKAAAIVLDLLTLARRGVSVTEVVNLNHIVSEYLISPENVRIKGFHRNIKIKEDLKEDLLPILGSPVHLSKTLMNLVFNAAEAMPDGGEILISTQNRYIDKPIRGYDHIEEGDYVILSVSDTGLGISPDDMERIFEPFYTKKVMGRNGTGLGMPVVWGTVKDHKGYIDVQSTEKLGATFTLYFPVTRKEAVKDKVPLSIEDYMGKGELILVIDDVEEQREIAFKILIKLGYSVRSVSSGEEAVDYLKENSADLLILDMIMDPGIDGLETYKRILEIHPKQKAIIASGFSETDRVKEAQRLGAGAYIKKPYLLEKIAITVRDELDT